MPEFADLPPSQIVPALADRGIYIASESTFYRILRKENMQHHRGNSKAPERVSKTNKINLFDFTLFVPYIIGYCKGFLEGL